jgi:hypothetical protein
VGARSLSDVIRRNTTIDREIPDDVFHLSRNDFDRDRNRGRPRWRRA